MNNFILGLYGIYFVAVGTSGNFGEMKELVEEDTKPFTVWIAVLLVLAFLYQNDTTKEVVKPFITLALVNFALQNYGVISSEVKKIVY